MLLKGQKHSIKKRDKLVLLQDTYLQALSVYLEVLFFPFQVLVFLTAIKNHQIDWLNILTLY